jgi:hypothetical protein
MKNQEQLIKINLSPEKKESISNAFFKWSITIGKVVIIFTQLIAMGALAFRFYLDRQIIDLHDQIRAKENIVKEKANDEAEFRSIQKRLADIRVYSQETQSRNSSVNQVLSKLKETKFIIKQVSLSKDQISIESDTSSVIEINDFIKQLKLLENIESISVSDVEGHGTYTSFSLLIDLKRSQNDVVPEQATTQ